MNEVIKTKTIGKDIAQTTSIGLVKTTNTMLIFRPMIHSGGVRGTLVRYKKKTAQSWSDLKNENFEKQQLKAGEYVEIELKTESLKKLFEEVKKRDSIISEGIEYGSNEYITVDKNKVIIIDDTNKKEILEQILEKGYTDEYWDLIKSSMPDLADRLVNSQFQENKRKILYEFQERLSSGNFSETTGDDSWQKWIYENNWLFGVNYKKPIEKTKINITGIMPDYLFPTLDGFIDVLEIKLPSHDVILKDNSHAGSWRWSGDANKAIGQVVNYLNEIDRLRLEIEKNIKTVYGFDLILLKPRAYILIGDSTGWLAEQKEALRKLNYSLHGIEVITYADLLTRGNQFTDYNVVK